MFLLTILLSFVLFGLTLAFGVVLGYALGYRNDRTLKQQIGKLKVIVRQQNKSAQLQELTTAELKEREDWDFRSKLAELTNNPVTMPDVQRDSDPDSIGNNF